jgi:hypothetical protein
MKHIASIMGLLAVVTAHAVAGVAPAPVSSGKNVASPLLDPCAGPISYHNLELLYAGTGFGDFRDDADGIALRAEYSLTNQFFLTGTVGYDDWDTGNLWTLSGGAGASFPLTETIHLVAEGGVMWARQEQDVMWSVTPGVINYDTISDDDFGWYVRPHLRAKFGCFTVHAGAVYEDVGGDDQWGWFVQGYYQIATNWDLTAGYGEGEDTDRFTAGVRFRY